MSMKEFWLRQCPWLNSLPRYLGCLWRLWTIKTKNKLLRQVPRFACYQLQSWVHDTDFTPNQCSQKGFKLKSICRKTQRVFFSLHRVSRPFAQFFACAFPPTCQTLREVNCLSIFAFLQLLCWVASSELKVKPVSSSKKSFSRSLRSEVLL